MKNKSSILLMLISLSLLLVYFTPIWEINLDAPQYPEGLGFEIWVSKMTGDLQTVNSLNHYIGMKSIQPDSITELKIMPYLIGLLILTGLLIPIFKKRNILIAWVFFYTIIGIAGVIDFYLWEYDYGHNLNPEAAIKVPGMSYQPPLIGEKALLNFTASSYPSLGGMILIAGAVTSILILFYEMKYNKLKKI